MTRADVELHPFVRSVAEEPALDVYLAASRACEEANVSMPLVLAWVVAIAGDHAIDSRTIAREFRLDETDTVRVMEVGLRMGTFDRAPFHQYRTGRPLAAWRRFDRGSMTEVAQLAMEFEFREALGIS